MAGVADQSQTEVYAFGSNSDGQLGLRQSDLPNEYSPKPVKTLGGKDILEIVSSRKATAAVGRNGILYTAGGNDTNELGRDGRRFTFLPVTAVDAHKVSGCGVGNGFLIVLTSPQGQVFSVGSNANAELGLGDRESRSKFKLVKGILREERVAMVSSGDSHTLGLLTNGGIITFGAGRVGQMGNGQFTSCSTPQFLGPLKNRPIVSVQCGATHCLAMTSGGIVFAWGGNAFGQLGVGDTRDRLRPTEISSIRVARPSQIFAGAYHSMALTPKGTLFSWGKNNQGQCGHGSTENILTPRLIQAFTGMDILGAVGDVSCGNDHSMVIVYSKSTTMSLCGEGENGEEVFRKSVKRKRTLYGFGSNACGQLGMPPADRSFRLPKKIKYFSDNQISINRVFCGAFQTFVTSSRGDHAPHEDRGHSQSPILSATKIASLVQGVVVNGKENRASNEMRLLEQSILDGFSSPSILNASFLQQGDGEDYSQDPVRQDRPPEREDEHGRPIEGVPSSVPATNASPQLNLHAVRSAYKTLLDSPNLKNKEVLNVIHARLSFATHRLSETLRECFFEEYENLRVFLVVFENPILLDAKKCHVALERIIRAWMKIPKRSREILFGWLQKFPSEYLAQIVHVLQNFLTFVYGQSNVRGGIDGTPALMLLSHIYNVSIRGGDILPQEMFYNSAVSSIPYESLRNQYHNFLQSGANSAVHSLCLVPCVFEPSTKHTLLRIDATSRMADETRTAVESYFRAVMEGSVRPELKDEVFFNVSVSRESLLSDAITAIKDAKPSQLHRPLRVHFKGEDGIDEGGLTKEFCSLAVKELLLNKRLFEVDPESKMVWFATPLFVSKPEEESSSRVTKATIPSSLFEICGALIGLAMYNGVYIDLKFPHIFYSYLEAFNGSNTVRTQSFQKPSLNDLAELRPMLARSLKQLGEMSEDELLAVDQSFVASARAPLSDQDDSSESKGEGWHLWDEELKPGGASIPVCRKNVQEFVELYTKNELFDRNWLEIESFARGFHRVVGCPALTLCRANELELLLCGNPNLVGDFGALKKSTMYMDGYTKDSKVVQWFWDVVSSFTEKEKRNLLFFVTGNDRVPLKGLSSLIFRVQRSGDNDNLLPAAHTCFNIISFPEYSTKDILRKRFAVALENITGFNLA
jgi:alpha-tubulin suppressor-like RCC1 family protein